MRTSPLIFDKEFAMSKWGISEQELPEALVIQGQRISHPHLSFVEQTIFPTCRRLIMQDVILGQYHSKNMLFASGFGAALLSDITHFACLLGVKYIIIIGTIGGLSPSLKVHDVIIPQIAQREDGISSWYVDKSTILQSNPIVNHQLEQSLLSYGIMSYEGNIISVPSMLCETTELINHWSRSNISGVDLETSAVFAVAHKFEVPYAGMLYVIDNLIKNHDITQMTEVDRVNSFEFMKTITKAAFDSADSLLTS